MIDYMFQIKIDDLETKDPRGYYCRKQLYKIYFYFCVVNRAP